MPIKEDIDIIDYISPFDGLYEAPYTLEDWAQDIFIVTKEYQESIVYKEGIIKADMTQSWMLVVLLAGYASIAFVRSAYRKRFSMLFQTLFNWKVSKQIIRYEKVYTHPVNILLTLNFLLCIPLFFGTAKSWYTFSYEPLINSFTIVFIPLLFYLLIKLFAYKFSGWLLMEQEVIEEYVFQANLFNKYLGVIYLILATLLIYSSIPFNWLLYIGISILIFFLAFQIVRGVIIGVQNGKSLLYIILYLCTLEILPWLVMAKWIKNSL